MSDIGLLVLFPLQSTTGQVRVLRLFIY